MVQQKLYKMCRNNCILKAIEGCKRLLQFENNKEVYDIFIRKKNGTD